VIGKTQQGKSSFINKLLKEKRAKEGKGKSETKEQISYHLDGIPLMINDIEGFIGEDTINNVVTTINKMQEN
jgi:ribosome biogenesis GTPase A